MVDIPKKTELSIYFPPFGPVLSMPANFSIFLSNAALFLFADAPITIFELFLSPAIFTQIFLWLIKNAIKKEHCEKKGRHGVGDFLE